MRTKLFLLLLLIDTISCEKKKNKTKDYREEITDNYIGIRVDTHCIDTIVGYEHDTSEITISMTPSELDSIVDVAFIPSYSTEDFSFIYLDGQFVSTSDFHPPSLSFIDNSIYFKHQAGLAPIWIECFAKKDKF